MLVCVVLAVGRIWHAFDAACARQTQSGGGAGGLSSFFGGDDEAPWGAVGVARGVESNVCVTAACAAAYVHNSYLFKFAAFAQDGLASAQGVIAVGIGKDYPAA